MNLIRKYKIHRLSPCLNGDELEIISFIENKLKDLKVVKRDNYPESTFYIDSYDETILEQYDKNDWLRVSYKDFWEVLEEKYLLNYIDIQNIIRYMVLIHLKFRAAKPFSHFGSEHKRCNSFS